MTTCDTHHLRHDVKRHICFRLKDDNPKDGYRMLRNTKPTPEIIEAMRKKYPGCIILNPGVQNMTNEVDHSGSNALIQAFMDKNTEAMTYEERQRDANEWNARQKNRKHGLMNQVLFDGIMYSMVKEPAYRLVYQDHMEDRTVAERWQVVANATGEINPDQSFMWDQPADSELDAAFIIAQDIQKRALKALMPRSFE